MLEPELTPELSHELISINASLFILLVLACFAAGAIIRRYKVQWLPESGASMILGFLCGVAANFSSTEERAKVAFSSDIVFFALLPPIILDAGYTLKRRDFFGNIGTISLLALAGTCINNLIFGALLYAFAQAGAVPLTSLAECLLFGAIISATDPVATLAVLGSKEVNAHPLLYTLVFGESVLNDAVAMTLFATFRALMPADLETGADGADSDAGDMVGQTHNLGAGDVILGLLKSCGVAVASVVIGVAVGLACCFLFRKMQLLHAPVYELMIVGLCSMFSYVFADMVGLSGVMSIFFCAIVLAHRNYWNLSIEGQLVTLRGFKAVAHICDTFVFAYIGISVGLATRASMQWSIGLILLTIALCIVVRALHVFPLLFLANRYREETVKPNMQSALWLAGLRGPVCFMLVADFPGPNAGYALTSIMVLVVFSTLVGGGLTIPMLRMTGMHGAGAPAAKDLLHDERRTRILEPMSPARTVPPMIDSEGNEIPGSALASPSHAAAASDDSPSSGAAFTSPSLFARLSARYSLPERLSQLDKWLYRHFGGRPSSRELKMGRLVERGGVYPPGLDTVRAGQTVRRGQQLDAALRDSMRQSAHGDASLGGAGDGPELRLDLTAAFDVATDEQADPMQTLPIISAEEEILRGEMPEITAPASASAASAAPAAAGRSHAAVGARIAAPRGALEQRLRLEDEADSQDLSSATPRAYSALGGGGRGSLRPPMPVTAARSTPTAEAVEPNPFDDDGADAQLAAPQGRYSYQ